MADEPTIRTWQRRASGGRCSFSPPSRYSGPDRARGVGEASLSIRRRSRNRSQRLTGRRVGRPASLGARKPPTRRPANLSTWIPRPLTRSKPFLGSDQRWPNELLRIVNRTALSDASVLSIASKASGPPFSRGSTRSRRSARPAGLSARQQYGRQNDDHGDDDHEGGRARGREGGRAGDRTSVPSRTVSQFPSRALALPPFPLAEFRGTFHSPPFGSSSGHDSRFTIHDSRF